MASQSINSEKDDDPSSSTHHVQPMACQGSMGLHQNNFRIRNNHHESNSAIENVIVEVFRKFRDRCISKIRDGITSSPRLSSKHQSEVYVSDSGGEEEDDEMMQSTVEINIDDLPFYCKLIIISKLDTQDICNLSMTSRHWKEVCSDSFLWRELLYRDMLKWHSIGRKSFPLASMMELPEPSNETDSLDDAAPPPPVTYDLHKRLCNNSNTNYKALYFHSAYQRHKDAELIGVVASAPDADKEYDVSEETSPIAATDQQLASNQSFARFMRNLWMKMRAGDGEVIMLGPGMESPNTSKIFRRLLWARPDLLITQRLLPGSQDGVGSGVELDFKGTKRFNLIALYSGNNRDRRRRFGLERLLNSNIVEPDTSGCDHHQGGGESDETAPTKFKLRELVLNFLQQRVNTYRLIYVVDATKGQSITQLAWNRLELEALLEGIRSFENSASESREQTRSDQRHANVDSAAATALSSIFSGKPANSPARRPLLVLCCVRSRASERIPCVEVATLLDLAAIADRPWYVQDVTVDNLNGLDSGLEWLFKQE